MTTMCSEDEDLPVAHCEACRQAIYRDEMAVYLDGRWYCDGVCLAEGLDAEWGPAGEIADKMAAQ